jgi:beta-lactam-binding protein with PASTA domain
VLSQDPAGGTQKPPGATVTIVVGKLSAPTTPGPP